MFATPLPPLPAAMGVEKVCTPVNVCAESVRAIVALVDGKVRVTPSVPARVSELLTVSTFALDMVRVPVVVVIVRPLMVPGMTKPDGIDSVQLTVTVPVQVPVAAI